MNMPALYPVRSFVRMTRATRSGRLRRQAAQSGGAEGANGGGGADKPLLESREEEEVVVPLRCGAEAEEASGDGVPRPGRVHDRIDRRGRHLDDGGGGGGHQGCPHWTAFDHQGAETAPAPKAQGRGLPAVRLGNQAAQLEAVEEEDVAAAHNVEDGVALRAGEAGHAVLDP